MSSEVPSFDSVSSVFSPCLAQCPVHPPQSNGEGSLNSNNPAQHQSIFYFIKGAAALLLGCNDSTDLPPIGCVSQAFGDIIKEMCQKCMWIINFVSPRRKFVCARVCAWVRVHERMCVLLYTSYRLIQNLCCQLLRHWRDIAKKKKKRRRPSVLEMPFRYTATASHSHLEMVMQKRWCFMQTNSAETHQQKLEKWRNKIGFRGLCIQTTAGSHPQNLFMLAIKSPVKSTSLEYPSKKPLTVMKSIFEGFFFFLLLVFLTYRQLNVQCVTFLNI